MNDAELVADFYDASIDAASWPQALRRVSEAIGADACALVRRDFASGRSSVPFAVGIDEARRDAYRQRHGQNDPWLADEQLYRPAMVFGGSEVVPTGTLVASAFYRDWLAPADLLHAAFIVLHRQQHLATLIVAYRGAQRPAFQRDELAPLRAIAPRLTAAYQLGLDLARQRLGQQAAAAALDAMPIGVITLDRGGAIVSANRFGQAILAGGEGVIRSDGGLTLERPGLRIRLGDVIAQAQQTTRSGSAPDFSLYAIPRYRRRRPLTCLVSILASADNETPEGQDARPAAVVYIGDPDRSVRVEPQRIARLYGLSRAEARVAALLARGHRLDEAADTLGIAYETVRKHLKQIFTKVGVARQAELVRVLVTGPAGLAVSSPIVDRDDA